MKCKHKLFGFKIWVENIKKRVILPALRAFWRKGALERFETHSGLANLGVGDLVSNCSGFNVRITGMEPVYAKIGRKKLLIDIEFDTTGGCCSLYHCDVREPILYEEAKAKLHEITQTDVWVKWPSIVDRYKSATLMPDGTLEYSDV